MPCKGREMSVMMFGRDMENDLQRWGALFCRGGGKTPAGLKSQTVFDKPDEQSQSYA